MKIAITGGGTGGHLSIARAIREELNKKEIRPVFVGSEKGQDRAWFEEDSGFEATYFFKTEGVVDKKGLKKLLSLGSIVNSARQCRTLFKKHQIEVVFSVGGFSAAPAGMASILNGKKLYVHEQNAVKGALNKSLTPFARTVFSSFDPKSPVKDYPVSQQFFDTCRKRESVQTVIFLGGSQGAKSINDFALESAAYLRERGIAIIHQAGKNDLDRVRAEYVKKNIDADVFDFDLNLIEKVRQADFAISRAGASTLWELAATGLPALFVPYPYAAGDHQYHNARHLADQNLGFVKRQDMLSLDVLKECLESDIAAMSEGLRSTIAPGGAEKIVEFMRNAAH